MQEKLLERGIEHQEFRQGGQYRLWCGGVWGAVLNRVVRETLSGTLTLGKYLNELEGVSYAIPH